VENLANSYIVWLYLARRDKAGIKLVSQFNGIKIIATRISNLNDINLPLDYRDAISSIIYQNRFLYEPWIESSEDFSVLRKNLKLRGYTNIPESNIQMYGSASLAGSLFLNTSTISQNKTMIRKIN